MSNDILPTSHDISFAGHGSLPLSPISDEHGWKEGNEGSPQCDCPPATSVSVPILSPSSSTAATELEVSRDPSTDDSDDFVSTDDEIDIEENSEPFQRYLQGSYYPIRIGEVLGNVYRVEHKLGHGGFSTVWMAYDTQNCKVVALKIMVPGDEGEHELWMQKQILQTVEDTSHFLTYQDTFTLQGMQGRLHRVLVFPVRGPSLRTCLLQLPMTTRMSAAKQLLETLNHLHKSDFVHCDLNNGCVMWDMASLDEYNLETKYEYLGRPKKFGLMVGTWKQADVVKPVDVPQTLLGEKIYLGDFGLSIKSGTPVKCKWQAPTLYCAPERFHNADPSFASDMWSYMCLFVELYIGLVPFRGGGNLSAVSRLVDSLGPLPSQWKGRYNAGGTSDDSWYDQSTTSDPIASPEAIIMRVKPEIDPAELSLVSSVLSKSFCYFPEQRLTAAQLLQDPSFKALMEIYGC